MLHLLHILKLQNIPKRYKHIWITNYWIILNNPLRHSHHCNYTKNCALTRITAIDNNDFSRSRFISLQWPTFKSQKMKIISVKIFILFVEAAGFKSCFKYSEVRQIKLRQFKIYINKNYRLLSLDFQRNIEFINREDIIIQNTYFVFGVKGRFSEWRIARICNASYSLILHLDTLIYA